MESRSTPTFAPTQWSVVEAVQKGDEATARVALGRLYETYSYPLYAYLRRRGSSPDEAQDLLHAFFLRMIEKDFLQAVDPQRGRFRTFLLTALKHFLLNEVARGRAQKRGGGVRPYSVDADLAETRYGHEPRHAVTPEFLYERRWALDLLQRVEERLAGEWLAADKQELFRYLLPTLTREPDAVPHAEIARHLRTTLSTVQNAARRLRQRFRALLRQELREHVADPAALDEEERYLFEILAR